MPATLTYPGVYIEEIPSGVRTITGVATSIAAFVGWAPKGPTDRAQRVLSWADYERYFGGMDARSLLGYSVYHFFANGGQQAYVVRLITQAAAPAPPAPAPPAPAPPAPAPPAPAPPAPPAPIPGAPATVAVGTLTLTGKNPGVWAKNYAIGIKNRNDPSNSSDPKRFRLSVLYVKPGSSTEVAVETFENLSMSPNDPRYVVTVVNTASTIVNVAVAAGAKVPPADTPTPSPKLAGGAADGDVLVPSTPAFDSALLDVNGSGGVKYLDRVDLFNLLCVPGESTATTLASLEQFCRERRAFLIADCAQNDTFGTLQQSGPNSAITGDDAINAAFYFPWVNAPDPLDENRPTDFPPCGFVAGLYARTDTNRGVWKAPAGTEASLGGVIDVTSPLTDLENGVLNVQAVNCIRSFPVYGTVLWGSRTLQGNNERGSEWKYIPVRRTALFIEESLYRGTQWVVFEPNDEPLWAQIRLNIGAFMNGLFRQGAFQGTTPRDAYFVKCDKETTTQNDINLGIVNIIVGFAPLKPAEFVVIKLQQIAGQIQT